MANEIERKFLVRGTFREFATLQARIVQGYIVNDCERTVRVRRYGEKAYLTIKGPSSNNGLTRYEFEKEISLTEAEALFAICLPGIIDKTRYIIPCGIRKYEVDVFHGENAGLIMAEIELGSENEYFQKAAFLGREVTGDVRFYNSYLSQHPFCSWNDNLLPE